MADDNGLVDEFAKLQEEKKQIDERINNIRKAIIKLAQEKQTDILFGDDKTCSIKEYEKLIYPDDKETFLNLIKQKGLYDKFSSLNYFKLSPVIRKKEIDSDILKLIKFEKDFRLSLKDK